MRNSHGSTWNMARNTENEQNGKHTLQDMDYGEKQSITSKMRNAQFRTWYMARKMQNMENVTNTLQELEYGEKNEKRGK